MGGLKWVSGSIHAGMGVIMRWECVYGQHLASMGPNMSKPDDLHVSSMCAWMDQWGLYLGDAGENDSELDKNLEPCQIQHGRCRHTFH